MAVFIGYSLRAPATGALPMPTTSDKRIRKVCSFTLSQDARDSLKAASTKTGMSMSRLVERLALNIKTNTVTVSSDLS